MRIDRRTFSRLAALARPVPPCRCTRSAKLNIRIGHTGITWPWGNPSGPGPMRLADPAAIEQIVKDIASLGFYGIELFGWQIDGMEAHGGLGPLLEKYKLPLIRATADRTSPIPRSAKASIDRTVATAKLVKKYGGKVIVFGPNGVPRDTFNFAEHKAGIVDVAQRRRQSRRRSRTDARAAPAHRHVHRDARRNLRRDGSRRHALSEVRSGHRPAAEGRIGSRFRW